MGFKTKLDYSDNRQIKQHLETLTALSGATSFGLPFAELTKGPITSTSGITEEYFSIASTFSGNNTTTIYSWYDPRMELGHSSLSALTPSNSAETQTVDPVFAPSASVTIDGNVVNTAFSGVTFDLSNIIMVDLGGGNYNGTVEHLFYNVLSAATSEYTGRTIWADVSGITRTDRLIVTNTPIIGNVLTCIDAEGMASWQPASTPPVSTDIFVTGGSYSSGTATFTNNTGGTFNVTGFSTGGTSASYWSAGTGVDAVVTINGGNLANGNYAVAEGFQTQANGNYSHSEGLNTISFGRYSHTEGNGTTAIGDSSHAEGSFSHATGQVSHAEGNNTTASGVYSHAEGTNTIASGFSSHAQGRFTVASGYTSHAGGNATQANGDYSFVHGDNSRANGNYSIVLGRNITGNTADTTYVNGFNIKTLTGSTSVNNLGIDSNGFVVIGSIGTGSTINYWGSGSGINSLVVLGASNTAIGDYALVEGRQNQASGAYSHAEGLNTKAIGFFSHAQGEDCEARGAYSHAEGSTTIASGTASHAGGSLTIANGSCSFVHGSASTVNGNYSIVLGRNITGNTADTTYVDHLTIKSVLAGPGSIDLGVDINGNVVNQASDIRLKENINTIENALDKVIKLRGVSYQWKDRINGGDAVRLGFIAQEVQEITPELITENGEYLGVQYKDVPALLVEAIKELVSGKTKYSNTYLETQTILAEDNNIELNYNGTLDSSIGGGVTILRAEEDSTSLILDADGNWVSNVNILSKGFVIPEYTPTSSQDAYGVVGNIVQDDDYIYIKRNSGWKRTAKLESF